MQCNLPILIHSICPLFHQTAFTDVLCNVYGYLFKYFLGIPAAEVINWRAFIQVYSTQSHAGSFGVRFGRGREQTEKNW